jgi:hypothetical protein
MAAKFAPTQPTASNAKVDIFFKQTTAHFANPKFPAAYSVQTHQTASHAIRVTIRMAQISHANHVQ